MFITQSAEEVKQSLLLNSNTAIVAVRVGAASLWSVSPDQFGSEATVESEARFRPAGFRRTEADESLIFAIEFRFIARTSPEGSKPRDLIKISCVLEAEYQLNPQFKPTDEQIKAFHRGNAVFNG